MIARVFGQNFKKNIFAKERKSYTNGNTVINRPAKFCLWTYYLADLFLRRLNTLTRKVSNARHRIRLSRGNIRLTGMDSIRKTFKWNCYVLPNGWKSSQKLNMYIDGLWEIYWFLGHWSKI